MKRHEALAALHRLDTEPGDDQVGPSIEAVARALRAGDDVTTDEIRATVALLPEYLDEIQRIVIAAARADDGDKPRLTWWEVGDLLGYPGATAAQRANTLARKVGLLGPPVRRRGGTDTPGGEPDA